MTDSKDNNETTADAEDEFKFPFWQRLLALIIDVLIL